MRLHLEGESYEELHMAKENSWGKYLLRSNGMGWIIWGLIINLGEVGYVPGFVI